MIIVYRDIITNINIVVFYIQLNNKIEVIYKNSLESTINTFTQNRYFQLGIEAIIIDSEILLKKVAKNIFLMTEDSLIILKWRIYFLLL